VSDSVGEAHRRRYGGGRFRCETGRGSGVVAAVVLCYSIAALSLPVGVERGAAKCLTRSAIVVEVISVPLATSSRQIVSMRVVFDGLIGFVRSGGRVGGVDGGAGRLDPERGDVGPEVRPVLTNGHVSACLRGCS
jgi:hypothetical protein